MTRVDIDIYSVPEIATMFNLSQRTIRRVIKNHSINPLTFVFKCVYISGSSKAHIRTAMYNARVLSDFLFSDIQKLKKAA